MDFDDKVQKEILMGKYSNHAKRYYQAHRGEESFEKHISKREGSKEKILAKCMHTGQRNSR
jgi:hypothetical protein